MDSDSSEAQYSPTPCAGILSSGTGSSSSTHARLQHLTRPLSTSPVAAAAEYKQPPPSNGSSINSSTSHAQSPATPASMTDSLLGPADREPIEREDEPKKRCFCF